MKNAFVIFLIIVILLIGLTNSSKAQDIDFLSSPDMLYEIMLFGRQPSAKTEAMGRSFMSSSGEASSAFYNPAATSGIEGYTFNGGSASPFYLLNGEYKYYSVAFRLRDFAVLGYSQIKFNQKGSGVSTDEFVNLVNTSEKYSHYQFNISKKLKYEISIGLNFNYIRLKPYEIFGTFPKSIPEKKYFFPEFGLKLEHVKKHESYDNNFKYGIVISNFINSKMKIKEPVLEHSDKAPVMLRFGSSYEFVYKKETLFPNLNTFTFNITADYTDILNSQYRGTYNIGIETSIFEILNLRFGGYREKNDDFGTDSSADVRKDFTYGYGFRLPFESLFDSDIPLEITLDYVSMPHALFTKTSIVEMQDFSVFTLGINWKPGK